MQFHQTDDLLDMYAIYCHHVCHSAHVQTGDEVAAGLNFPPFSRKVCFSVLQGEWDLVGVCVQRAKSMAAS